MPVERPARRLVKKVVKRRMATPQNSAIDQAKSRRVRPSWLGVGPAANSRPRTRVQPQTMAPPSAASAATTTRPRA